jgi:hypothetical protein
MSHRTAVWPPQAGLSGAAGSQNRGLFPPLYPPSGNHGWPPPSASPGYPQLPPGVLALTPLPPSRDHSAPPHPLTNVLPKRCRLS